jgi:hypothetical protein
MRILRSQLYATYLAATTGGGDTFSSAAFGPNSYCDFDPMDSMFLPSIPDCPKGTVRDPPCLDACKSAFQTDLGNLFDFGCSQWGALADSFDATIANYGVALQLCISNARANNDIQAEAQCWLANQQQSENLQTIYQGLFDALVIAISEQYKMLSSAYKDCALKCCIYKPQKLPPGG